jgi:hypothetical protein
VEYHHGPRVEDAHRLEPALFAGDRALNKLRTSFGAIFKGVADLNRAILHGRGPAMLASLVSRPRSY